MRSEGMREWIWAIRGMDDRSLLAAAELARRHEIWDRAINTADRTQKEHNFNVRYLAPYRDVLGTAARARSLDEPLVLGLVRQESRFMSFAKSTVGASGLMQLMPATAAWVAGKMGMSDYAWSRVHHPEVNAKLGTFYLRQVLDELGGHPVVAAAAYNAGPGRARRWRDIRPLEGAIYAETIPFSETRDYAKKVMVNSIYYAAVQGQVRSLKARLGVVTIGRPAEEAAAAARVSALP
jgi:soluble lytic murein transglycosylase